MFKFTELLSGAYIHLGHSVLQFAGKYKTKIKAMA